MHNYGTILDFSIIPLLINASAEDIRKSLRKGRGAKFHPEEGWGIL